LLPDKYLLALRCLKASLALDKDHPKVSKQATRLRKALEGAIGSLAPKVKEVIESELAAVPGA
jgi:peptide alpha-N-acetyltransferase